MLSIAKPIIGKDEKKAVLKVLDSAILTRGNITSEFENQFAGYIGTKYAVTTSSGTSALILALLANNINRDDEVITTPFSFIATASVCVLIGAKPIFVDIEEDSFNLNPDLIEKNITPKTRAILVVHLFGRPCRLHNIISLCQKHHLALIEDCCQAHGAAINNHKVGSFGTGCFSFYATKNMTTGEGGMVTTNLKNVYKKLMVLRNHGQVAPYKTATIGYNFFLTDIQSAIGIEQLKKLDIFNQKRINNALYFNHQLADIKGLILPQSNIDEKHVFHQYTVRVTPGFPISRNRLLGQLRHNGIDARIFYPIPIHQQIVFKKLGYHQNLPIVKKISKEVISLPIHPSVTKRDLRHIVSIIKQAQSV